MQPRNKEGATLALTVTAVFFIIILGVGLFFLAQMIGGGREAQHATDAGNLNVAKQALKSPYITASSYSDSATGQTIDENVEFSGLMDNTNQINLSNYNRLVGKAFLVACNASAEGTANAYQNAQAVLDSVEGSNGAGQQLAQALYQQLGSELSNFFYSIAHSNSLRMLNWNQQNQIGNDSSNYQMSYMRQNQGAPSNLQLINNGSQAAPQYSAIPPGATVSGHYAASSSNTSNSQSYFVGYSPITVKEGNNALTIYGVPLRPGLEPHTVSQAQFTAAQTSPMQSSGSSLIPPNAFQSQSAAAEMHGSNLLARSSAIVGSLNVQYPLAIPQGYIVINNSGPSLGATTNTSAANIFSGELMGNGVYIMTAQPSGNVYFSMNPGDYNAIVGATTSGATDSNGNPVATANLNGTSFQPSSPNQNDVDSLYAQLHNGSQPANCNNTNSFPNVNANCANLVGQIQVELLKSGTPTTSNPYSGLMAIEYIKAQLIAVRGSFDASGCGTINGAPPCTGLKGYSMPSIFGTNKVNFGSQSTPLGSLLSESGDAGNVVYSQIVQRLYEIHPNANSADISNAMNLPVQFEAGSAPVYQYLYWVGSSGNANTGSFEISSIVPPGASSSAGLTADGNTVAEHIGPTEVGDLLVDVDGDGGYPHPFDCEPSPNGLDSNLLNWTPSSGRGNLLGVLQFQNCASSGSTWCCPC